MSVDFDYYLALRAAGECTASSASRRSLLPSEDRQPSQRRRGPNNSEETERRKLAHSDVGLPIGLQIVSHVGDEAALVRVAGDVEEAKP